MQAVTIHRQVLKLAVGQVQHGPRGALVEGAVLDAQQAVFHHVDPADAMPATQFGQTPHQVDGRQHHPIQADRYPGLEVDGHGLGVVGGGLGRDGQLIGVFRQRQAEVVDAAAFGAGAPEAAVLAEWAVRCGAHGDGKPLGVGQLVVA